MSPDSTDSAGVAPIGGGPAVALLDEQPFLLALLDLHQGPRAAQLVALELEQELALLEPLDRIADRDPLPPVPHDDGAGAVVALRDEPLEIAVLDRMILDVHREPLLRGVVRRSLGHRPGAEHALHLEPEVPVQPGGRVLVHDEQAAGLAPDTRRRAPASARARAWRGTRRGGRGWVAEAWGWTTGAESARELGRTLGCELSPATPGAASCTIPRSERHRARCARRRSNSGAAGRYKTVTPNAKALTVSIILHYAPASSPCGGPILPVYHGPKPTQRHQPWLPDPSGPRRSPSGWSPSRSTCSPPASPPPVSASTCCTPPAARGSSSSTSAPRKARSSRRTRSARATSSPRASTCGSRPRRSRPSTRRPPTRSTSRSSSPWPWSTGSTWRRSTTSAPTRAASGPTGCWPRRSR